MSKEKNYISINKASWNKRTEIHVNSEFYDLNSFKTGKSSLNLIELELLGDVSGKKILHLQCHFGQDTLSLARLGAEVTGVDLSDKAIEKANLLTQELRLNASFICCDIYDLPNHLNEQFDIVFTSYGTIGWLPDLDQWASVVSHFLKPQGKFVFVEFHPVVWMFDDYFTKIEFSYFKEEAIETHEESYTDKNSETKEDFISWNHGLAEVISALLKQNILITDFQEYNYSPYNCFKETIEIESNKFRIKHLDTKIPMVYSLLAEKR